MDVRLQLSIGTLPIKGVDLSQAVSCLRGHPGLRRRQFEAGEIFLVCCSCNDGEAARLMLIPAPRIDYKSLLVVGALVRGIARYV